MILVAVSSILLGLKIGFSRGRKKWAGAKIGVKAGKYYVVSHFIENFSVGPDAIMLECSPKGAIIPKKCERFYQADLDDSMKSLKEGWVYVGVSESEIYPNNPHLKKWNRVLLKEVGYSMDLLNIPQFSSEKVSS